MYLKSEIKNIVSIDKAIHIYALAFSSDPLHKFIFKNSKTRYQKVKQAYTFIVKKMVPHLNLAMKGIYINDILAGCFIYTTNKSKTIWTEILIKEAEKFRKKVGARYVKYIRQYASEVFKQKPRYPHFYLNELAVHPDYQGIGLGKKLMQYAENQCKKNLKCISTALDTANPLNAEIYKRWGYRVYRKIGFYNLDVFCMRKRCK